MALGDRWSREATEDIQRRILDWYSVNRRQLPWRDDTDPYRILVSEIMLQQTGVGRVGPIYRRFIDLFPTFAALAEAPRQDVLRAWAGTGYNRRAIHLHECARIVCRDHAGRLPNDPTILARLPGLGPYTVAAVLSFAFHQDVATVDTNIRRVLGRSSGKPDADERELRELATRLLPRGRASDWNQALMDLGATICLASNPRCSICPVREICASALDGDALARAPARRVAERQEPYLGSRRFYRGRIVAILRDLPSGQHMSAGDLLTRIKPDATAADQPWLDEIMRGLAADGLASIDTSQGDARFSAPT